MMSDDDSHKDNEDDMMCNHMTDRSVDINLKKIFSTTIVNHITIEIKVKHVFRKL